VRNPSVAEVNTFEQICRATSDPAFYPHPVSGLERRDSHISAVFLTGKWVYKLKKPFNFGFLDYTQLDTRRIMCEREVELNRRLTSGVYKDVVEIREVAGEYHLEGFGKVVEYAVKMRQLPDNRSLARMILSGDVHWEEMVRLGQRLGNFYAKSCQSAEVARFGRADVIKFNLEENFRQVLPFTGMLVEKELLDFVEEASRGFFRDYWSLFERRIAEGRICDGHGDLRAEHVYFVDQIQIIDCVEFNDRFRYGDVAADLAFLHMDIERLGSPELSLPVISAYIERTLDFGIYTLLDFYSCYRSIVKMKVSCLTWRELDDGVRRTEMKRRVSKYLDLALRYAVRFSRPTIWIFCGLPGTGKSTFAEKVKETFGIPLFRSDEIRMDLPEYRSHSGPVPLGTGIYKPELKGRVYAHLLAMAQEKLKLGCSVILDATFSSRKWREEVKRLSEDLDVNIIFFECTSREDTLVERLGRRRTKDESLSDARPEHLSGLIDEFQIINELDPEIHARIDTEKGSPDEIFKEILAKSYEMRRVQVERAMERL